MNGYVSFTPSQMMDLIHFGVKEEHKMQYKYEPQSSI